MYLNVDLGEEIRPNLEIEKAVMPYIDACNIASGGHAGDENTMRESIQLAKEHNVKIGAHPSYPDRNNFGRVSIKISDEKLRTSIINQMHLLQKIAEKEDVRVYHVKLHGALYNDAANNKILATLIVKAVKAFDPNCILFTPPNSILSDVSSLHNMKVHYEVFGDRNYNDDLSLMNRSFNKALITNKLDLSLHIRSMLYDQKIISAYGKSLEAKMDTICMHSDHNEAIDNIKLVSKWIREHKQ